MNPTFKKAFYVILISFGIAVLFNLLFFSKIIGISVFIFVAILLSIVFLFGVTQKLSAKKHRWLISLILFFSIMPSFRANEFLVFMNVLATFGLLMLLAHEVTGTPVILMKLRDYLMLAVKVPFRMFGRASLTVRTVGQIHSNVKNRDVWLRVLKGVVMAVPVLIIFGALFSQADLAFSQLISNVVNISFSESESQYLALLAFAFVAAMCFLSYVFFPKTIQRPFALENPEAETPTKGKEIEVLVFLGLIAMLFLVFICYQVTYLFGGEANIINAGFTYAEYARQGFWELLAVAFISLVLLLAAEKYASADPKNNKLFLIPAVLIIVEVMIIIVSAFKRLALYIDAYSMTTLRFYVATIICVLFVLFILLAVKFIRAKEEQFFAFGTLLTFLTILAVVNFVNPDAFIIRENIKQHSQTGKIDVQHAGDLSADAVPGKIELYNILEGDDKLILGDLLQNQKLKLIEYDSNWQSKNLARDKALRVMKSWKD